MNLNLKQLSSLEKVRCQDTLLRPEILTKTVLAGERFCYQICGTCDISLFADLSVESPLKDAVSLYRVQEAYMDSPATETVPAEDYITFEPGPMPDILVPLSETHNTMSFNPRIHTLWVRVDVPKDTLPGTYSVKIIFTLTQPGMQPAGVYSKTLDVEVLPACMPEQKLIYTRWFYADCIAVAHNVDIYSEEHWDLIDKYIAAAADVGINMILVPVHTPPLDTEVGTTRPCVQLVDIEKKGEQYFFSFEKFHRFIALCQKNGIRYFEIAHMFSQWGAKYAANIQVTENGETSYQFGWHVAADAPEYIAFLKQYIRAISGELSSLGILENTYFHVSDEPTLNSIDTYKTASDIIHSLIENGKTFDALSNYEFYESGLVECPVTCVDHIHEFLKHPIPNQWTYYCCVPQTVFTNSFMAMPSARTRILGFLLYKYNIKGFLHWGYNFYNSTCSVYPIDPYRTTSADGAFPSGDPFIVYPAKDDVYSSIRGEVFYDGIQDMNICFALEEKIGRDQVIAMIDRAAGFDLRFDEYPRNKEFLETLREEMTRMLKD